MNVKKNNKSTIFKIKKTQSSQPSHIHFGRLVTQNMS